MTKPPLNLNPRRLPDRTRPLPEKIRERLSGGFDSPTELARELGEPLSVVAFHLLRERPGQAPGAESAA